MLKTQIHVEVCTKEQLNIAIKNEFVNRVYVDIGLLMSEDGIYDDIIAANKDIYFSGPPILRKKYKEKVLSTIKKYDFFKGILIKNLESISVYEDMYIINSSFKIVIDSSVYINNISAVDLIHDLCGKKIEEIYSSLELSDAEHSELYHRIIKKYPDLLYSSLIYGRAPMMITANCVKKTQDRCNGKREFITITDRMNKSIPILCDCSLCNNIVYNSVPLSLHKYLNVIEGRGNLKLNFTNESVNVTDSVIDYFGKLLNSEDVEIPYKEFTNGHFKRGVE